jgi:hypothetical protein
MKKITRLPLIVLLMAVLTIAISYGYVTEAQGSYQPIASSLNSAVNVSWSFDGKLLLFQDDGTTDVGVLTQEDRWFQYDTDTKQLSRSNRWSLQPTLTTSQIQTFEMAKDAIGQLTFAFVSPNNRYIVYGSRKQEIGHALAIADLQNNTYRIINEITIGSLAVFDSSYVVKWSKGSTAFVVQATPSYGASTNIFYVSNFTTSLNNLSFQSLIATTVSSQTAYSYRVFDISPDGIRVLLERASPNNTGFILWNAQNPSENRIVVVGGSFIVEAAFSPQDADKVRFIGPNGLVEYALTAATATTLEPNINNSWVNSAWFAPAGNKVALLNRSNSGLAKLYVIDFSLLTSTPTPTQATPPLIEMQIGTGLCVTANQQIFSNRCVSQ